MSAVKWDNVETAKPFSSYGITYGDFSSVREAASGVYEDASTRENYPAKNIRKTALESNKQIIKANKLLSAYSYLMDEEDGPTQHAWSSARTFMHRMFMHTEVPTIATPILSVADNNSLDVFWHVGDKKLLINFPGEGGEMPHYYAKSFNGNSLSGYLSSDFPISVFFEWLRG